jgi:hypothetical protein
MRHRFYIFVKDRRGDTFVFSILNNYLYYERKQPDHPQDTGRFRTNAHNLYVY